MSLKKLYEICVSDKSFSSQARVSGVTNDSTLNESDVHASLLNSYLSEYYEYNKKLIILYLIAGVSQFIMKWHF